MAKITRYNGDLRAFAETAIGTERTIFGDVAQSDDITTNITADFLRGWGIIGVNEVPSKQDFNAAFYVVSKILAYLHQIGIAEYNATQEYHVGSVCTVSGVAYSSLTNTNIGNAPASSPVNWELLNITEFDARYTQQAVKVRQTVSQAPVDTAGLPSFLAATYAGLIVTTQNVSTGVNSLVATSSSGSGPLGDLNVVGQSTANLVWPACTASNTNYLPVAVSGGVLTPQTPVILVPIYQQGGTPAVTAGQYTFNISQMTMYLGNGTTAPAVNHVIVGEVVASATTITSTVAYALQGKYDSGWFAIAAITSYAKNHNIGCVPRLSLCYGATSSSGTDMGTSLIYSIESTLTAGGGIWVAGINKLSATFRTDDSPRIKSGSAPFYLAATHGKIIENRGW